MTPLQRRQTYRQDSFHSDLDAILNKFEPDPNTGKAIGHVNTTKDGYQFIQFKGKPYYIHRLVWMSVNHAFIPDTHEIDHDDDNRANNRYSNLKLVTHLQNMKKAKMANGEEHFMSKLTKEEVAKIRELKGKYTQTEIADMFDVCQGTVNHILTNRTWKVKNETK